MLTFKEWLEAHVDADGAVFLDDNHGGAVKYLFKGKEANAYVAGHQYQLDELISLHANLAYLQAHPKRTHFHFTAAKMSQEIDKPIAVTATFDLYGTHPRTMETCWYFKDGRMIVEFDDPLPNRLPEKKTKNNTWKFLESSEDFINSKAAMATLLKRDSFKIMDHAAAL